MSQNNRRIKYVVIGTFLRTNPAAYSSKKDFNRGDGLGNLSSPAQSQAALTNASAYGTIEVSILMVHGVISPGNRPS